jgi:hypothetical protein
MGRHKDTCGLLGKDAHIKKDGVSPRCKAAVDNTSFEPAASSPSLAVAWLVCMCVCVCVCVCLCVRAI